MWFLRSFKKGAFWLRYCLNPHLQLLTSPHLFLFTEDVGVARYNLIIMMQKSRFRAIGRSCIDNIIYLLHPTLLCLSATVSLTLSCGKIEADNSRRHMLLFQILICLTQQHSKRLRFRYNCWVGVVKRGEWQHCLLCQGGRKTLGHRLGAAALTRAGTAGSILPLSSSSAPIFAQAVVLNLSCYLHCIFNIFI